MQHLGGLAAPGRGGAVGAGGGGSAATLGLPYNKQRGSSAAATTARHPCTGSCEISQDRRQDSGHNSGAVLPPRCSPLPSSQVEALSVRLADTLAAFESVQHEVAQIEALVVDEVRARLGRLQSKLEDQIGQVRSLGAGGGVSASWQGTANDNSGQQWRRTQSLWCSACKLAPPCLHPTLPCACLMPPTRRC